MTVKYATYIPSYTYDDEFDVRYFDDYLVTKKYMERGGFAIDLETGQIFNKYMEKIGANILPILYQPLALYQASIERRLILEKLEQIEEYIKGLQS